MVTFPTTRGLRALAALCLSIALVAVVGCRAPAEVTSPWPKTDAERVVPKPAEPSRWPLTGLDAPSDAAVSRRVVSVKVENAPEARPQTALQFADVVYESLVEGGITRFNAVYHSQSPPLIGPVRSARISDTHIVPQYHALFVFSGSSSSVGAKIRKAGIENLSEDAGITKCYTRVTFKSAPHNLFVNIEKARQVAKSKGWPTTQKLRPFAFERRSRPGTFTVTRITVPFSPANKVVWMYDAKARTYKRVNNGKPHMDAATEKQLEARNVVVLWAKTHATGSRDAAGTTTLDINLTGSGRATLFRGGQRFDCTWAANGSPPVLKAEDGSTVRLAQGNTWFQVVPTNINIAMQ
ncbi:MAG: hypothetical protein C0418_01080 [Coriobacteriaceae bacterium]|nr:hypothetical protein [Coriobacteriaceae bacterium]